MYPQPDAHKRTLRRIAKQAVAAVGLELGAVDILTHAHEDTGPEHYVLEVNSAPGFQAELDTVDKYVQQLMLRCH